LIDDARYVSQAARRLHYDELHDELAAIFATRTRAEWLEVLSANDVPCGPIYNLHEVFDDPQIQHMGLQISMPRGDQAPIRSVGCAVAYSDTPTPLPSAPPELGQDTDAVLAEAGYGAAEIETLRTQGVVAVRAAAAAAGP
jgi:crotonobetainyl-CoA:carnitine CoA-transferase CaiB-like acyl-CoA transferase